MPNVSLLGPSVEPLGLRVRGTERDGQVVWLSSRRATIGSAPHATMRLRARGVAPYHCLLLRGTQHTIIRRWSPDTRRNGYGFEDAELAPGDQLSIGPIELEVVDPCAAVSNTANSAASLTSAELSAPVETNSARMDPTFDRLALQARSLRVQLRRSKRESRRRIRRLTTELRETRRGIAELERRLETQDKTASTETLLQRAEEERQALLEERRQWLQSLSHIEELLSNLEPRVDNDLPEGRLAGSQSSTTGVVAAAVCIDPKSISELRAVLESERLALETQCKQWSGQWDQREQSLSKELSQLAELQEALERQRAAAIEQFDAILRKQSELESRESEFAKIKSTVDSDRLDCRMEAERLDQQRRQLVAEREELEHAQNDLAKQRDEFAKLEANLRELQQSLESQSEELAALQSELDTERLALAAERENYAIGAVPQVLPATSSLTDINEDVAIQEPLGDDLESLDDSGRAVGPAVASSDATDVFARLRSLDILKSDVADDSVVADQYEGVATRPEIENQESNFGGNLIQADEVTSEASDSVQTAATSYFVQEDRTESESDDQSIQDYMAQLLQRVRGEGSSPLPTATPAKPHVAVDDVRSMTECQYITLTEIAPRTAAPERSEGIAAMRELANYSARHAIAKHNWKTNMAKLLSGLMLGLVGLSCGFALMAMAPEIRSSRFYGGLAAAVISLFWLVPTAYRTWNAAPSTRLRRERSLLVSDDTIKVHTTDVPAEGAELSAKDESGSQPEHVAKAE